MAETLIEKLESDPNALMMTSEQARDIAVAFLTRGARIALEMALEAPQPGNTREHVRSLLASLTGKDGDRG